jgi:hypothetical protein
VFEERIGYARAVEIEIEVYARRGSGTGALSLID